MDWISNSKGINGAFSGANFMHYENLGYDFLVGDGTGGLSIFSLKDPEHPLFVGALRVADLLEPGLDARGLPDTPTRYWEGENMTVDAKRKLVYLARDPRSFGNTQHPNGRTGLYIVDAKDPWHPPFSAYQPVPAGHTATCINDCRYLWSMGPANNGSGVSGQPQDFNGILRPDWTGVPVFVTDVRDPLHPYTYAEPVDQLRNNNHTAYTHSVDVDQHGIAWTSGFGGVRGFYTQRPASRPDDGHGSLRDGDGPGPVRGRQRPSRTTRTSRRASSSTTRSTGRRRRGHVPDDGHRRPTAGRSTRRTCLHHAGEHGQLHVHERRRLRPLRHRQPRRQLRRRGLVART